MFKPGDIIEWNGLRGVVASREEVAKYWDYETYDRKNVGKVWAFWENRKDTPTHLDVGMAKLIKRKLPRRTMPEWF